MWLLLKLLKLLKFGAASDPRPTPHRDQNGGTRPSSAPNDAPGVAATHARDHGALDDAHEPAVIFEDPHDFSRRSGLADHGRVALVQVGQGYRRLAPLPQ